MELPYECKTGTKFCEPRQNIKRRDDAPPVSDTVIVPSCHPHRCLSSGLVETRWVTFSSCPFLSWKPWLFADGMHLLAKPLEALSERRFNPRIASRKRVRIPRRHPSIL